MKELAGNQLSAALTRRPIYLSSLEQVLYTSYPHHLNEAELSSWIPCSRTDFLPKASPA
jgi:hypothetical protein